MSTIYGHNDKVVVDYLKDNPNLPYLVSYPRTGSHWVRLVMEGYFEKPSLVVLFNKTGENGFTCYHTHDLTSDGLTTGSLEKREVIYLYRDIAETVYSNLKYNNKSMDNENFIKTYSESYAKNLTKWMSKCDGDDDKLLLSYKALKNDFSTEFKKLTDYFGEDLDKEKLDKITEGLNKDKVKSSTTNIYSKIDDSKVYNDSRRVFMDKYSKICEGFVFDFNEDLKKYF